MNSLKKISSDIEMVPQGCKSNSSKDCYKTLSKKIHEMKQEILVNTLTRHIPGQPDKKFLENQKIINKINELEQMLNSVKKD